MKTKFLPLAALFLGLCFTYAQDTLYVMKGEFTVDKFNTTTQLDSLIYYNPDSGGLSDFLYVMKSGIAAKKFNIATELDSIIFYQPDNAVNWPTYSEASQSEFSPRVLTVLLDFSNTDFNTLVPNAEHKWAEMIYGKNQGQGNHYWYEITGGRVQLNPASETNGIANNGVVKVKLNVPKPITSVNPDQQNWFRVALDMLESTVDFASFDDNGDHVLTDHELSVMFVLNVEYSRVNQAAAATANISLNHTISGTSITLQNYARGIVDVASSIGTPMHEFAHHFFELKHPFNGPFHALMGVGCYAEDPEVTTLINPSSHYATRPTGMLGVNTVLADLITEVNITQTTLGVTLYAPEMGQKRNIITVPIFGGRLYIENRNKWGYDQSIPFCEGSEGGVFFTEVIQYIKPLNIPLIEKGLTETEYGEGDWDVQFCDFYAHAGHNDSFEFGGWRFENISVAGPIMTLDIVKTGEIPTIDHYNIVYFEKDPNDPINFQRKIHKRIGLANTPVLDFNNIPYGDDATWPRPVGLEGIYTTGEAIMENTFSSWQPSSNYVYFTIGSPLELFPGYYPNSYVNAKFNLTQSHTSSATVSVGHMGNPIGHLMMINMPAP